MNPYTLTAQVDALAPDEFVRRSSHALASPEKWTLLAANGRFLWGQLANRQSAPLQITISLAEPTLGCTCTSRKFPCVHTLALLRLYHTHAANFSTAAPSWAAAHRPLPVPGSYQRGTFRSHVRRQEQMAAGMAELSLWLRDLVRGGLGVARTRPPTYWSQMADRLVDARAGAAAVTIRSLAVVGTERPEWADKLLRQIGRLYLLTQGFARIEDLPLPVQSDLYAAAGWLVPDVDETAVTLTDEWLVLGCESDQDGGQQIDRYWVWGLHHNRPALLIQPRRTRPYGRVLLTGTILSADLIYHSSQAPLRASVVQSRNGRLPETFVPGYEGISAAISEAAAQQAANPWQSVWPLALSAVWLRLVRGSWLVCDADGMTLPLADTFTRGWHLLAFNGERPFPLFGLWHGTHFTPISTWHDGSLLDIRTLPGVA